MKTKTTATRSGTFGLRNKTNQGAVMKSLVFISCLACTTLSQGALLLQENFNELDTGDLNGQNGWTAATELDVAAGGLSYSNGDIAITGGSNHAVWSGANVQPLGSKAFASQSGEVWFSLTLNVSATDDGSRFWFYVSDDADLGNAGVIGQINSGSTALLTGYRATTSQFTSGNTSLNSGTTLFIVGRFSQTGVSSTVGDYDKMEMWVNPDSTMLGVALTATNTAGSGITTGLDTFALTALGTGSTVLWDNLLVGTTQADVLDVYTSTIPEPSTYAAFGGLAALGLAVVTRRRRSAE